MRLLVPGGEDALGFAKPRLKALFARMHLLPDRAAGVSFVCEVSGSGAAAVLVVAADGGVAAAVAASDASVVGNR